MDKYSDNLQREAAVANPLGRAVQETQMERWTLMIMNIAEGMSSSKILKRPHRTKTLKYSQRTLHPWFMIQEDFSQQESGQG